MLSSDLSVVNGFKVLRQVNCICEKGPIQCKVFYVSRVKPKNDPSDDLIIKC